MTTRKSAAQGSPLVIDASGIRLVLSKSPEAAWATGKPRVLSLDGPVHVEREVQTEAVPAEHKAWLGEHVQMFGPHGERCSGRVDRLTVLSRFEPHFFTRSVWRGDEEDVERPSDDELAQLAWDEGADGQLLTALVTPSGDCEGVRWAQPEQAPAPHITAALPPGPALSARALEALRALPAYATIQTRYLEETPAESAESAPYKRWEDAGERSTEVRLIEAPSGERLLWTSVATAGSCSDFNGELGVVFAMRTDGSLELVSDPSQSLQVPPEGATDLDQDGKLELVLPDGFVSQTAGHFGAEQRVSIPSHDCPC